MPVFTSGVYALSVNGYNCTWKVTVSGSVISGAMTCPPATRADALSGTVVQGESVTVTRDCSGAFAGCSQTYVATTFDGRAFRGAMTGSGGGGPFTLAPATPPAATPPTVTASPVSGTKKPGQTVALGYSVKDASGRAKTYVNLYDGGKLVARRSHEGPATGQTQTWDVRLGTGLKGPLFFCVWASNAAGKRTPAYHTCKWISLLVPIARVSNGCGGEGWDAAVAVENHFGNTGVYIEPPHRERGRDVPARRFEVSFVAACNLHDAGYGGQMVEDTINGGIVDYHNWTRKQADDKFQADMSVLCRKKIPASAPKARRDCEQNLRYWAVRKVGDSFFDAGLMQPGTQAEGPRNNG